MDSRKPSHIRPGAHIALRLPSGLLKSIEIQPNITISIGKYGSFHSNSILGRPYHLTYEILEKQDGEAHPKLRVVPASELHAEVPSETPATTNPEGPDENKPGKEEAVFEIVGENGEVIMRNNRLTIDDPSRQQLSQEEIEELKKAGVGSGKEIIAKIMAAHSALEEKTSFSLAKYTLRKSRKYMRRFTVLPMDTGLLTELFLEREPQRTMELREEGLGLITSWANIHFTEGGRLKDNLGGGRWLVVDDTGGMVVAVMAEKLGILHAEPKPDPVSATQNGRNGESTTKSKTLLAQGEDEEAIDAPQNGQDSADTAKSEATEHQVADFPATETLPDGSAAQESAPNSENPKPRAANPKALHQCGMSNTLTLVHGNTQPNVALLKYFGFNPEDPSVHHPLYTNLRTLTWLQLVDPEADQLYNEPPPVISPAELEKWKSGKRGSYFRKRRRWERVKRVVDDTVEGGFDGLVVASFMEPAGVLKHLLPLVRGGGQVVVYSPTVESLTELMDFHSRERKSSYLKFLHDQRLTPGEPLALPSETDFPINPTLLLNPMLQTARAIEWQVLPGRTHPLMTSRGGAEGYLFSATRVIPADGPIAGRGKFMKKRKLEAADDRSSS